MVCYSTPFSQRFTISQLPLSRRSPSTVARVLTPRNLNLISGFVRRAVGRALNLTGYMSSPVRLLPSLHILVRSPVHSLCSQLSGDNSPGPDDAPGSLSSGSAPASPSDAAGSLVPSSTVHVASSAVVSHAFARQTTVTGICENTLRNIVGDIA